jgi:hypothetical protein
LQYEKHGTALNITKLTKNKLQKRTTNQQEQRYLSDNMAKLASIISAITRIRLAEVVSSCSH